MLVIAAFIGAGAFLASCAVCCLYARYKRRLRKHLYHVRLLENAPSLRPVSIAMLPTPPHSPPPIIMMAPPDGGLPVAGYDWRDAAWDNRSCGS